MDSQRVNKRNDGARKAKASAATADQNSDKIPVAVVLPNKEAKVLPKREAKSKADGSTSSDANGPVMGPSEGPRPIARAPKKGDKPPRPVPVVFKDLSEWAKAYQHAIPECDEAAVAYCKQFGISYRTCKKAFNNHSVSHICRDEAFLKVIVAEGRGKQTLTVLDWFGSGRNLKISPEFGPFGKTPVDAGLVPSSVALSIRYTMAPDVPITGDHARNLGDAKVPLGEDSYDVVLVQDVYHDGPTPTSPFSPQTCLWLCGYAKTHHIYIANRSFPGMMGADVIDGKKFEQVFYRDEHNMIISSPEPNGTAYASHPDTNWLFDLRSKDGVDITQLQKIGPFHLVRVAATHHNAQPLGAQIALTPCFDEVKILVDRKLVLFGRHYPCYGKETRTILVHVPTVAQFGLKFGLKQANGQIIDSALATVQRRLEDDPQYRAIAERFPDRAREIISGTLMAVMYNERKRNIDLLHDLRVTGVLHEDRLSVVRSGNRPVAVSYWKKVLATFAMLLCLALVGIPGFGAWAVKAVFSSLHERVSRQVTETLAEWIHQRLPAWFNDHVVPHLGDLQPVIRAGSLLGFRYRYCSAFLEEGLWMMSPVLGASVAMIETLVKARTDPMGALGLGVLHTARSLSHNSALGPVGALCIHLWWNMMSMPAPVTDAFGDFARAYVLGQLVNTGTRVGTIPAGTSLPSYVSLAETGPPNFRGSISLSVDGVECGIAEALERLSDGVGKNRTFPILATNRLLHQPANVEKNLLVAILFRLHNDPFVGCPDEKDRHRRWAELADLICRADIFTVDERVFTLEECYKMMGPKAARLKNALEELTLGRILVKGKNVNVKWNETLTARKDVCGIETMKPRAIQNLPAEVHAMMTPYSRVINHIMHNRFDGSVFVIDGVPFAVVMACGYTGAELSALSSHFDTSIFTIFVSGDDSAVCFGDCQERFGMTAFGEADQSAFDHTQDNGPMKEYQFRLQRQMGIPEEFTRLAFDCCSSGYYARKGRLFVKGTCGTQMPTGITTTTVFNSMSTAAFWIYWRLQRKTRKLDPVEAGRELGFGVKFVGHENPRDMTFLKGSWHLSLSSVWHWLPLPSLTIKLGKVISDPVEITVVRRGGRKIRLDAKSAAMVCAYALASSYGNVPSDYPIVGAFLSCLKRNGTAPRRALRRLEEGWKPSIDSFRLDRDGAMDFMFARYGITRQEIHEVEGMLGKINSLPCYIEHLVFDKLADVDY